MGHLAITGGSRVKRTPFPSYPIWDKEGESTLIDVLHSGKWSKGPQNYKNGEYIERFEKRMGALHNAKYALALANCTAALDVSIKSIGIEPGDEVIVTPYSFVASATCILQAGAIPVFADIKKDTWNIDPEKVVSCITSKTRAIVVVHFGGQAADMDKICVIARKYNIKIIEDCAHAIGAQWNGNAVGTIGDMGCFSFQESKNVTCGEGGIIVTNNEDYYKKAYSYHMSGRKYGGQWYEHDLLGWNYKITEFQAALAYCQLNKMDKFEKIRSKNAEEIIKALNVVEGIETVKTDQRVTKRIYHLVTLRYDQDYFKGISKNRFLRALAAEGVPLLDGYKYPIYKNELFKNDKKNDYSIYEERCPIAELTCKQAIWIPQNYLLGNDKDISELVEAIYKVVDNIDELRRKN